MRNNRRSPPIFPTVRITNLTSDPLYIGLKGKTASGFWLAARGETGDSIELKGLDLSDRKVYGTLYHLHYITGQAKVEVVDSSLMDTIVSIMGTTTTTTTSSP